MGHRERRNASTTRDLKGGMRDSVFLFALAACICCTVVGADDLTLEMPEFAAPAANSFEAQLNKAEDQEINEEANADLGKSLNTKRHWNGIALTEANDNESLLEEEPAPAAVLPKWGNKKKKSKKVMTQSIFAKLAKTKSRKSSRKPSSPPGSIQPARPMTPQEVQRKIEALKRLKSKLVQAAAKKHSRANTADVLISKLALISKLPKQHVLQWFKKMVNKHVEKKKSA